MLIPSQPLQGRSKFCRVGRNKSLPALLDKCLQKLILSPDTGKNEWSFQDILQSEE